MQDHKPSGLNVKMKLTLTIVWKSVNQAILDTFIVTYFRSLNHKHDVLIGGICGSDKFYEDDIA